MLIGPDKSVVGSVSGGCVEADVYAIAEQVLDDGHPVLKRYDVSDADALGVGLSCGGTVEVFLQKVNRSSFADLGTVAMASRQERAVAVATMVRHHDSSLVGRRLIVDHREVSGTFGSDRIDAAVLSDARGLLAIGKTDLLSYGPHGEPAGEGMQVFVECLVPRPRMLVFGATDFAAALARLGGFLGYRVTVCDARAVFATQTRFAGVDEVVVAWPHNYLEEEISAGRIDARTAICVLTHDLKFDVPVLRLALTMPVRCYVGAMGSRRTHEQRQARLLEEGVAPADLERLASPIGLDLGARTPEETAVSIMAEIISTRADGAGGRLSRMGGAIHHDAARA